MPVPNCVHRTWPGIVAATFAAALTPTSHAASELPSAPNAVVMIGDQRADCTPPPLLADNDVYLPADLLTKQLGATVSYRPDGDAWTIQLCGHELVVRAGQRTFERDGERSQAPLPPEMREYTLFVPLWTISYGFELGASAVCIGGQLTITIEQPAAVVRDIRYHDHPEKFRVVIDLTAPAEPRCEQTGRVVKVTLPKPPPGVPAYHRLFTVENDIVKGIMQRPTREGETQVAVELAADVTASVFSLPNPPRIVIDVPRPGAASTTQRANTSVDEVVPPESHQGPSYVPWETRTFSTPRGAVRAVVMRVDLTNPRVAVRPALAGATIAAKATASEIAARHGAVAAVNGGFFAARGDPLGMLVIDGEWIKAPILRRTVLGITARNELLMDNLEFDGLVTFSTAGSIPLDGLNCNHEAVDELVLYTQRWGDHLSRDRHVVRVAIDNKNTVTAVNMRGEEFSIPPGGYALSATGGKARQLARIQVGETATVTLGTEPRWDGVVQALGGGPRLVRNGMLCVTALEERFRRDVWATAAARTAVGIDKQGRLVLVSVDARGASDSQGMTLTELAATMSKLGCVQAMNLDGGSSSTFVVNGHAVNASAGGWQRKVSNALLVLTTDAASAQLPGS